MFCRNSCQFQNGCAHHLRRDRIGHRVISQIIAGSDNSPRLDTATRPQGTLAATPVIASAVGRYLRRATKFTHGDDECRIQQAALLQVVDQRRCRAVKDWPVAVRHVLKVQPVRVPAEVCSRVIDILDPLAPVDLNVRDFRFHQASREQTTLAELSESVVAS